LAGQKKRGLSFGAVFGLGIVRVNFEFFYLATELISRQEQLSAGEGVAQNAKILYNIGGRYL